MTKAQRFLLLWVVPVAALVLIQLGVDRYGRQIAPRQVSWFVRFGLSLLVPIYYGLLLRRRDFRR